MAFDFDFIQRFNPASFRGVKFLSPDESVERGKKLAIHEYPNSNFRYAEDLGKIPPIMDLTGIIHGAQAFNERRILEQKLEEPGIGELIHPVYGSIQVQSGPFTVSSSQKRVGEFIFRMKFYASDEIEPTPLGATEQTVNDASVKSMEDLLDQFEDNYDDPDDTNALTSVVDTALDGLDAIQDAINFVVNPIQEYSAKLNTVISQFRNGIYGIMQSGSNLKNSLLNVYNNFVQLSQDPQTLADAWDSLINFFPDTETDDSTSSTANAKNNQNVFKEFVNLMGFSGLLNSYANTEFDTVDDLQEALDYINSLYSDLFLGDDYSILLQDSTIRKSFLELYVLANKALDLQRATAWKIININPGRISMALTTYKYYQSLDNIDIIIKLNPNVSVANFNETIKVVVK